MPAHLRPCVLAGAPRSLGSALRCGQNHSVSRLPSRIHGHLARQDLSGAEDLCFEARPSDLEVTVLREAGHSSGVCTLSQEPS